MVNASEPEASSETTRLVAWRAEQIEQCGATKRIAEIAAMRGTDPHDVESLIARGCPVALALRIARPL